MSSPEVYWRFPTTVWTVLLVAGPGLKLVAAGGIFIAQARPASATSQGIAPMARTTISIRAGLSSFKTMVMSFYSHP